MDADRQKYSNVAPPTLNSATEKQAQPNAQVREGGFENKINNVLSGTGNVDRVQQHAERQNLEGAQAQMDQAQEALNSK